MKQSAYGLPDKLVCILLFAAVFFHSTCKFLYITGIDSIQDGKTELMTD